MAKLQRPALFNRDILLQTFARITEGKMEKHHEKCAYAAKRFLVND